MEILSCWTKVSFLGVFLILFAICPVGFSVDLSSNGGYDLVFAIEEDSPSPAVGENRYIQNIQASLQVFSNQLWRASKGQFYVRSVEVLIPSNWTVATPEIAASHSFQTADFRLSTVTYPHAENHNLCGLPGKFVELPLPFFNNANSNDFGPIWKTLMVLFARFRYGVWEEHGFVGDEKFPYFHQNFTSRAWEVTGCSNEPIVGKFLNAVDKDECTIDWTSPADSLNSCRFVPDRVNNKATTSLMHFHWMDSVTEFCDDATHNKLAENKQNLFCDHKSVMEVIRSTPDYNMVTSPSTQVPAIQFKTVKQPEKPIFYLLLDRGLIQGSLDIARLLPQSLAQFFRSTTPDNRNRAMNIAAIGSYPSDRNGSFVKDEVDWSPIGQNLPAFLTAIGELKINGPLERDFSRAILEVAEKIKQRNPPNGAVILVVKYGADLDNLKNSAPEAELITTLNEQNILLHSIELATLGRPIKSHLAQVSRATDGTYTTLSTLGDATTAITNVLNRLHSVLHVDYFELRKNRRTIIKNAISSTITGFQVPVPDGIQSNLEIFYTTESSFSQNNFILNANVSRYQKTLDWNESEDITRFTYRFRFDVANLVGINNVVLRTTNIICDPSVVCDGRGSVLARTDIDVSSPAANNVEVEVSTSSNVVDLSLGNPLGIFVKVTKSGTAVGNVVVTAAVTNTLTLSTEMESLHDDGLTPDVIEGDGIYSAGVAPANGDGSYKIAITVKNQLIKTQKSSKTLRESSLARLLPIDQGAAAGCEVFGNCTMEIVQGNFMQVVDAQSSIEFKESARFAPAPGKIFSLFFWRASNTLTWLAPRIPGRSSTQANSFEIRRASTRQQLQEDFESCENVPINIPLPGRPGFFHLVILPSQGSTTFYAIKSIFNGQRSQRSNIVGFESEFTLPTDPTTVGTTPGTGPTTTGGTGPTTTGGTGPTTTGGTGPTTTGGTGPTTTGGTGSTTTEGTGPTTTAGPTTTGGTDPTTTGGTTGSPSSTTTAKPEHKLILAFVAGLYLFTKMR